MNKINEKVMNMKQLVFFCIVLYLSAGVYAQQANEAAKPKVFYHLIDSVGIGNNRGLKLYVASTTGDSKTFNNIFGYFYEPSAALKGENTKRAVDLVTYKPDNNRIILVFRNENGDFIDLNPSPQIQTFLDGKGSATMAEDCNIRILE